MDSGAFTQLALCGGYDQTPQAYAALVRRYAGTGLVGATTQDWMTEVLALRARELTMESHQALTIERYDAICDAGTEGVYLIPVLQGRTPDDYRRHLDAYGGRIGQGAWWASAPSASGRVILTPLPPSYRPSSRTGRISACTALDAGRRRCWTIA